MRKSCEYWIVDPEMRQITICQWNDGRYENTVMAGSNYIESDVASQWELTVDQIFGLND